MNPLKRLAGQTAIYGVGTILGRLINYFLTPFYIYILSQAEIGVFTEGYAYIAILLVILTFGMETALFKFTSTEENKNKVFSTAFLFIAMAIGGFWFIITSFAGSLAEILRYPTHPEYVYWIGIIIGLDALSAVPMAWMRQQNQPKRFTLITLTNIFINVGLNLFFYVYCRSQYLQNNGETTGIVKLLYNHDIGVGYIFISNLIASFIKLLLCMPTVLRVKLRFDVKLALRMITYSWPLIIAGIGFIINERIDVIMLKFRSPVDNETAMQIVGIYGGCYKMALLMSIFIQAYRFAAEPFFFAQEKEKDSRKTYAKVMNYFVILCCCLYLFVMLYLDFLKLIFIPREAYWEGLKIVPIIMMANLLLGLYINLSMWYKLSGQTLFGAWFSILGAVITITLNYIFIPKFGYMAAAWTTLITYSVMVFVSYKTGQKYYKIPYNVRKIALYIGLATILSLISRWIHFESIKYIFLFNTLFFIPFFFVVYQLEPSVKSFIHKKILKR